MEENNKNTNGYTGEYGNSVEAGTNMESGGNPFSYGGTAEQENETEPSVNAGNVAENKDAVASDDNFYEGNEAMNMQKAVNDTKKEEEPTDSKINSGWTEVPNQWEQPKWENQYDNSSNSSSNVSNTSSSGDSSGPFLPFKKVAACVVLAVIFGAIAGICFQGVRYMTNRYMEVGKNTSSQSIIQNNDSNSNSGSTIQKTEPKTATTDTNKNAKDSSATISDVSPIVEQTMPSIVAISSTEEKTNYSDIFGQYSQNQDTTSCGSGIIVGENKTELLIATNNHVIDGAKTISVQFIDNKVYKATAKGTDSSADLAVVAVKLSDIKSTTKKKIKIAALGDSSKVKVGEMAIAIGNALGYGQSVTVGYISAKDRQITETSETDGSTNKIDVIQTDAAINPGNSGGALLNTRGEVIGINSAKTASSTVEGMGYAIPISKATPILNDLMTKEALKDEDKGYLGISGRTVTDEAQAFNMPNGVYVAEVAKGGACAKAGVKKGDIITAINNMEVTSIEGLKEKANSYRKGTTVTLTLKRNTTGKYKEKKVKVTLQGPSSINNLQGSQDNGNSSGNSGNEGGNSGNQGGDDNQGGGFFGNDDPFGGFFGFGN